MENVQWVKTRTKNGMGIGMVNRGSPAGSLLPIGKVPIVSWLSRLSLPLPVLVARYALDTRGTAVRSLWVFLEMANLIRCIAVLSMISQPLFKRYVKLLDLDRYLIDNPTAGE